MKVCLFGGGDLAFRREICHPAYSGDRGSYNNWGGRPHGTEVWNGPIRNMTNGMLDRWYGLKQIEIHLPDRNRQEVWMDEGADDMGRLVVAGNENRWRLLARYDDVRTGTSSGMPVGDWTSGSFSSDCTGCLAESRDGKPIVNGLVRLEPYSVTHSGSHDISIQNTNAVVLRIDGKTMRIGHWSLRKIQPP
jgi:hypothetical protein